MGCLCSTDGTRADAPSKSSSPEPTGVVPPVNSTPSRQPQRVLSGSTVQVSPPRRRALATLYTNRPVAPDADYSNPGTETSLRGSTASAVKSSVNNNFCSHDTATCQVAPTVTSIGTEYPYSYLSVDYRGRVKVPYRVESPPKFSLAGDNYLDVWNENALHQSLEGFCYLSSEDTIPPVPERAPAFSVVKPHPGARISIVIPRAVSPPPQLPNCSGHTYAVPAVETDSFEVGLRGSSLEEWSNDSFAGTGQYQEETEEMNPVLDSSDDPLFFARGDQEEAAPEGAKKGTLLQDDPVYG